MKWFQSELPNQNGLANPTHWKKTEARHLTFGQRISEIDPGSSSNQLWQTWLAAGWDESGRANIVIMFWLKEIWAVFVKCSWGLSPKMRCIQPWPHFDRTPGNAHLTLALSLSLSKGYTIWVIELIWICQCPIWDLFRLVGSGRRIERSLTTACIINGHLGS